LRRRLITGRPRPERHVGAQVAILSLVERSDAKAQLADADDVQPPIVSRSITSRAPSCRPRTAAGRDLFAFLDDVTPNAALFDAWPIIRR
jgi:hypothetical protein